MIANCQWQIEEELKPIDHVAVVQDRATFRCLNLKSELKLTGYS